MHNRGRKGNSSSTVQCSQLVSAVTSSSVMHAQQKQQMQGRSGHAIAVLKVVQQHWQTLMQERIVAAQMLLPDIPLVSEPRSLSEMEELHATGDAHNTENPTCQCAYAAVHMC